jgi:polygalacturonase
MQSIKNTQTIWYYLFYNSIFFFQYQFVLLRNNSNVESSTFQEAMMRLIASKGHTALLALMAVTMLVQIPYVAAKDHHVKVGDNLQATIDHAEAGDRILIGEGEHHVEGNDHTGVGLLINGKKSLTLEGQGKAVIVAKEGWVKILTIMSSEDITVKGLHLTHDVERGYCFGSVVEISRSENVQILDSVLDGSGTQAVVVKDADGVTITKGEATRNTEGVFDISNSRNVRIDKVRIAKNDNSGYYKRGILDIADSSDVSFTNNSVINNQNAYFNKVSNSMNLTIKGNSFEKNAFQAGGNSLKKER